MNLPVGSSRSDIIDAINEWVIGRNGERDREILIYRLIDGLTYEQIATRYQERHPNEPLSVDTIKRAIYKREPQLFKHFPG